MSSLERGEGRAAGGRERDDGGAGWWVDGVCSSSCMASRRYLGTHSTANSYTDAPFGETIGTKCTNENAQEHARKSAIPEDIKLKTTMFYKKLIEVVLH